MGNFCEEVVSFIMSLMLGKLEPICHAFHVSMEREVTIWFGRLYTCDNVGMDCERCELVAHASYSLCVFLSIH